MRRPPESAKRRQTQIHTTEANGKRDGAGGERAEGEKRNVRQEHGHKVIDVLEGARSTVLDHIIKHTQGCNEVILRSILSLHKSVRKQPPQKNHKRIKQRDNRLYFCSNSQRAYKARGDVSSEDPPPPIPTQSQHNRKQSQSVPRKQQSPAPWYQTWA